MEDLQRRNPWDEGPRPPQEPESGLVPDVGQTEGQPSGVDLLDSLPVDTPPPSEEVLTKVLQGIKALPQPNDPSQH
jgi:hypothetical protein